MPNPIMGGTGTIKSLLLLLSVSLTPFLSCSHATSLLLGSGSQSNHLLILFGPGQILRYELRHDGNVTTGAELLIATIQATGGLAVTTAPNSPDGSPILLSSQIGAWDGQGLFAHFYDYGWGVFANGFASGTSSAAADGSWTSYFSYQIGGASADFTTATVGAADRRLADGDQDAYVLTGTHPFPGLASWQTVHQITDLEADPDGDGLQNLFEYALRQHPHIPDAVGVIRHGRLILNGTQFLTLTYRRPHDEWADIPLGADGGYDGVGYTVETSEDLVNWLSGPHHVTQNVTPDPSGPMATVEARVPMDSGKKFLRLRIQIP